MLLFLIFISSIIGCKQIATESLNEIVFIRTKKYSSSPTEIALINIDRNMLIRWLEIKNLYIGGLNWSPNGKKLAFELYDYKKGSNSINVIDYLNKNYVNLTDALEYNWGVQWNFDGTKISFLKRIGNRNPDMFVMDIDGKNKKRLFTAPSFDLSYKWSSDGKKIIIETIPDYGDKRLDADFIKYKTNSDIYIVDSDGKNQMKLTDNLTNDRDISLSSDGRKIAYISLCNDNYEIFVMDIDGKNKVRLTNNSVDDWQPKWSPDGKNIAFISQDCMLYLIDPDGKNQIKLTEIDKKKIDLIAVSSFVWSPDGKRIAVCGSSFNGSYDIYIIDINSKEVKNLTNTPDWDETNPSWRPVAKK